MGKPLLMFFVNNLIVNWQMLFKRLLQIKPSVINIFAGNKCACSLFPSIFVTTLKYNIGGAWSDQPSCRFQTVNEPNTRLFVNSRIIMPNIQSKNVKN
jgi:hypothetical protein